jgi:glucose/arabinose dehydrogenase
MLRYLTILGLGLAVGAGQAQAATLPPGFTDTLVADVPSPTAFAFASLGRMLIAEKSGKLWIYKDGALLQEPALTIPASQICTDSERGLLGVAADPTGLSPEVYIFYTYRRPDSTCVNRVSSLHWGGVFVQEDWLYSGQVLIDNMPSPAGNHNAGDLQFGKDGHLYVSIGDGGCDYAGDSGCAGQNDAARDLHVLTGKVLRITTDGSIPQDNPFQGPDSERCNFEGRTTPGKKCQETFAWGLRNPFRIAMDPNAAGTRFFINDVGQNVWEEIDEGQAGADYGWNCREGKHANSSSGPCNPAPAGMIDPIFEYRHGQTIPGTSVTNCNSITGGAFVPNGVWPGFDGQYLFADYVCGGVFRLNQSGGVWSASDFITGLGGSSAVHMDFATFGTTQALYYTTFANGGQVRRIAYEPAGNHAPTADLEASPISGAVPMTVTFDASGSSDPDAGDTLTYIWKFGDGTELTTTSPIVQYTYNQAGRYFVYLRVRDDGFAFAPTIMIDVQPGNTPPSLYITSPEAGETFAVGEQVTLEGNSYDQEDWGTALTWTVLLHHNDHTHPFLEHFENANYSTITFTAPAPEDLEATENSYLEIILSGTDSGGLNTTVIRNLYPTQVPVTFETDPPGLDLTVQGAPVTDPETLTSWQGWGLQVFAPNQTDTNGDTWVFSSWSDGGNQGHTIVTPASAATYTATFQLSETNGPADLYTLEPCRLVDTRTAGDGPALTAGETRTFQLTGACGVPATAKALAVNVTVFEPTAQGHLRINPAGTLTTSTSAINFAPGLNRANNAQLALSPDGEVEVSCRMPSGSVHFLIDVTGYYE